VKPRGRGRAALAGVARPVVASVRLTLAVLHLLYGMVVAWLHFPALDAAARRLRIQRWSAALLRRLGIELAVAGAPRAGATLLVANHVSWLDIAAIHAAAPQARFVSKADVKHWPLVGALVTAVGTLFIERESKRDALRVVHQMADALRGGDMVAVFPEGTTGPGPDLLPFHANLLQAAIATGTPVQGAVLRFHQPGHAFSPAIEFVGATTLWQSLWRVASAQGLRVELRFLQAQSSTHADRRALAAALREAMAAELHKTTLAGAGV
jgi:1-acyl-sn-glycerol-3-phosphate acyltransferase